MKARLFTVSVITILSLCTSAYPAKEGPVAWWKFDGDSVDSITAGKDTIRGNFKFVEGVAGKALKFDGLTTSVARTADKAPKLGEAFTIQAWVALGAYPWNWCPIVSQADFGKSGYYFGIDSNGRVGLCFSAGGVTIYKNGSKVASLALEGTIEYAPQMDLLIGRNHEKMAPTHPVRAFATHPSWYSFDGVIDEIKIYSRALSAEEIAAAFEGAKPKRKPDIPERRFPTAPDSGRFGAFYTRLKYYDEWDALWRTSDYTDILVQFDEHPIKVMFWRGSRYSPCWVTENGKWMADQSREEGGGGLEGAQGCCEHMSDAQCRHSHVRLIENNDARVVVHWRYALIDTLYRQAGVDAVTGWGLWGDEVYTIYP
ncbi:MAG: LamG domain-containing protein, partial [Planctomycetota bacterium]